MTTWVPPRPFPSFTEEEDAELDQLDEHLAEWFERCYPDADYAEARDAHDQECEECA